MEIIAPINAIISWEGYEIQGHIALCVALEKIKENIISGNSNDLWNLEIEGKEDFSFLYDINISSMIEVLRNDFSSKQIIMSTHEMDKENYILYKFYKYNITGQSFNVKDNLYGLKK